MAECFELKNAELGGGRSSVHLTQHLHATDDVPILAAGVFAVVGSGVANIVGDHLDDGVIALWGSVALRTPGRQPLRNDAVVLKLACFGAVGAEQMVTTVDRDDGLLRLAVQAIFGDRLSELRHSADLPSEFQNGIFRFGSEENAALSNVDR
jgi:hypothetical protein